MGAAEQEHPLAAIGDVDALGRQIPCRPLTRHRLMPGRTIGGEIDADVPGMHLIALVVEYADIPIELEDLLGALVAAALGIDRQPVAALERDIGLRRSQCN